MSSTAEKVESIYDRIAAEGERPVWISLVPEDEALSRARTLDKNPDRAKLPSRRIPIDTSRQIDDVIKGIYVSSRQQMSSHSADIRSLDIDSLRQPAAPGNSPCVLSWCFDRGVQRTFDTLGTLY